MLLILTDKLIINIRKTLVKNNKNELKAIVYIKSIRDGEISRG